MAQVLKSGWTWIGCLGDFEYVLANAGRVRGEEKDMFGLLAVKKHTHRSLLALFLSRAHRGSAVGSSAESSAAALAGTGPVPALGHRFAHAHQPRSEATWPLTALSDRRPIIEQTRSDLCRKNLRNEGSSKNLERKVSLRRAGELRNVAVNLPEELDRSLVSLDDGVIYNLDVVETPVRTGWKNNTVGGGYNRSNNGASGGVAAAPPAASASVESTESASTPFLERQQEVHLLVPNTRPGDVLVVNTVDHARQVAARMMSSEFSGRVFACDTEVAEIDVTSQSPCCHGRLICFSVHAGPGVDLSTDGSGRSTLWVDTYLDGDPDRQVGNLAGEEEDILVELDGV